MGDLFEWAKSVRWRDPYTSKEAAQCAVALAGHHHSLIMAALRMMALPLAAEQIGTIIGVDYVAVNRRLTELERGGLITKTTEWHRNRSGRRAIKYKVATTPAIANIMSAG